MKSFIKKIEGRRIVDIDLTPGDAGVAFEGDIRLAIYNEFSINEVVGLIGQEVTAVIEESQEVTFEIENGIRIVVDLCDDAYNGPEAMVLRVPGEPIVVWN